MYSGRVKNQEPKIFAENKGGTYDFCRVIPASSFSPHPSSLLLAALVGALLPSLTLAADGIASAASPFSTVPADQWPMVWVILGLIGLAQAVNVILSIWVKLRPQPPLRDQFAAAKHDHPEHVTHFAHREQEERCRDRMMKVASDVARAESLAVEEALSETLSDIRSALSHAAAKDEERASLIHTRINEIAAPLNKLIGRFEDHLLFSKESKK